MTLGKTKADERWIDDAAFIVGFDYNVHAANAARYGQDADWNLTRAYLQEVRPDLVLIQSLGYYGWSCYPSRVAPSPPGLNSTYVDTFHALCRELKIRLGFLVESFQTITEGRRDWSDAERARWFIVRPDIEPAPMVFCPNSSFADDYLIPYCLECVERYQPAAFWFDHSRTLPCYCERCRQLYRARYGEELHAPRDVNQRARIETFADDSLINAMTRVSRAIRQRSLEIVLSWPNAVDAHTLRPVFDGADWIAADEINNPNLLTAQFEAAYRGSLGAPAHVWVPDLARMQIPRQRPPELLRAEASTLLAHGVGITMYHIPEPLGYFGLDDLASARVASQFVRERASYCYRNQPIPHVAILASRAHNLRIDGRFQPLLRELWAAHAMLAQNHIPCDVVNDETLLSRLDQYDLVLLGEVPQLAPATAAAIERYAREGGRVFMIGRAPLVAEADAVTPDSRHIFDLTATSGVRIVRHLFDGRVAHVGKLLSPHCEVETLWRRVELNGQEAEPLFVRLASGEGGVYWFLADALSEYGGAPFDSAQNQLASTDAMSADAVLARMNFGKSDDRAGAGDVSTSTDELERINYEDRPFRTSAGGTPHPHLRRLIGLAVRQALGNRWLIRSDVPPGVEIVVNCRGDDMYVHLVNHTCGSIADARHFCVDEIPVLANMSFDLKWPHAARSVELLPDGGAISVRRTDFGYSVVVPRLHYHATVRFAGAAVGSA